jgi:hypothetical protein
VVTPSRSGGVPPAGAAALAGVRAATAATSLAGRPFVGIVVVNRSTAVLAREVSTRSTAIMAGPCSWSLGRRLAADHVGVRPADDDLGPALDRSDLRALELEETGDGGQGDDDQKNLPKSRNVHDAATKAACSESLLRRGRVAARLSPWSC